MHDNEVCICSITNHNKFDLSEYNEIKAIDKELVLFPELNLMLSVKVVTVILC